MNCELFGRGVPRPNRRKKVAYTYFVGKCFAKQQLKKQITMEKNIVVQENIAELSIIQSIHEIRGQKVMFDFDLAKRYEVETRVLNQAVKRNMRRFPPDFMFQLTKDEWENMKSQFVISSWGGKRKMPYVFTEQGIAMLSGLLNSDIAIDTNILIMRAFVAIRQYIFNYAELKRELDEFMKKTDMRFNEIFKLFEEFLRYKAEQEKPRNRIGFKQKNN